MSWYVEVPTAPTPKVKGRFPYVLDGTYSCFDSDPRPWSEDAGSGGAGFCIVEGFPSISS